MVAIMVPVMGKPRMFREPAMGWLSPLCQTSTRQLMAGSGVLGFSTASLTAYSVSRKTTRSLTTQLHHPRKRSFSGQSEHGSWLRCGTAFGNALLTTLNERGGMMYTYPDVDDCAVGYRG